MKTLAFILATFGLNLLAYGDHLYSPRVCPQGGQTQIFNLSSEAQPVWLQTMTDVGFQEIPWVLEKGETRTLSDADLPSTEFSLKTRSEKVVAISKCGSLTWAWGAEVSPSRTYSLAAGQTYKIYAQNLNPHPQKIMLRVFAGADVLSETLLSTGEYMTTALAKFTAAGTELRVEAEGRVALTVVAGKDSWLKEEPPRPAVVPVDLSGTYFMLTNSDGSDSFSVKIRDPLMIARARAILQAGEWKLMVARIAYSPRAENRPLQSSVAAPYSWAVEEVTNFNDFADISCDGSPELVEDQIFSWLRGGRICFWNYHLQRELSPDEVRYGQLRP